jgi:hypothetical protein
VHSSNPRGHDDLAEAQLEIPVRAENGVVQRALVELADRRVPVDPAVSDVADQGRRPTVDGAAHLDHRSRGQAVLEGRGDQHPGAPHGQGEERSLGCAIVARTVMVVGGSNCLGRQPGRLRRLRRRAEAVEDAEQKVAHVDEVGILVDRPLGAAATTDLNAQRASLVSTFRLPLHPLDDVCHPRCSGSG